MADRAGLRSRLGYPPKGALVLASIGGTSIGRELLQRTADAYEALRVAEPDLHLVLVCGPRLDPSTLRVPDGVVARVVVPRLIEHFAAADLAIVQGGGTTTLELTALGRPFLSFPLEGHREQKGPVADRLRRQRAGIQMKLSVTTADELARVALAALRTPPNWPSISVDGATHAARSIQRLLRR